MADMWEGEPVPLGRNGSEPAAEVPSPQSDAPAASGAADVSAERVLRRRDPRPTGWRRGLAVATGGALVPGPGTAEARRRELVALVKTPIQGSRTVAFVSRKGGVGKTTTCLLAGHTFASYRGDRVIALDANPDAGTLAHRLRRETQETVGTLLRDRSRVERYADVRAYTSQAPSRLEVIAADDGPAVTRALEGAEVTTVIGLLERHYNLLCLDTAAGVLASATQGVLAAADQLVLVSPAALDGARAASSTLDWLAANGHERLAASAIAVVNQTPRHRTEVDVQRIEEHFASRCRACLRIPSDPHLAAGADVDPDRLRPETQRAYLELAAVIAAGFATTGRRPA